MRVFLALMLLLAAWPTQAATPRGCYTHGTITSEPAWKSDRVRFYYTVTAAEPEKKLADTPQSVCDGIVGKNWPVELFFRQMRPEFASILRANKALLTKDALFEIVYVSTVSRTGLATNPTDSKMHHWLVPFPRD